MKMKKENENENKLHKENVSVIARNNHLKRTIAIRRPLNKLTTVLSTG